MKLLLDENLSFRLVAELAPSFPDTVHVNDVGLSRSEDKAIWQYAQSNGLTIVTKDDDFMALSHRFGPPPQVIILELGNSSNRVIADKLIAAKEQLERFSSDASTGLIRLL